MYNLFTNWFNFKLKIYITVNNWRRINKFTPFISKTIQVKSIIEHVDVFNICETYRYTFVSIERGDSTKPMNTLISHAVCHSRKVAIYFNIQYTTVLGLLLFRLNFIYKLLKYFRNTILFCIRSGKNVNIFFSK